MRRVISRVVITAFFGFIFLLLPGHSFASLFINEFSSYPSDSSDPGWPDWVEIYNSGPESVDLSLYRLRDSTATNKLDLSGSLEAGNFIFFDWSNKLNKTEDNIKLLLISNESTVDEVVYGDQESVSAPGVGQSVGRKTDGENLWVIFDSPTKGNSNNSSTPVPTSTSTPTPTDTPTPTLKPTSTPKPSPTPTKSPTSKPASTEKPSPTQKNYVLPTITLASSKKIPSKYIETSNSSGSATDYPDLVLGEKSSPSAEEKETKVLSSNKNNLSKILIGIGSLFFLACGILAFRSYRKMKSER